MANNNNQRKKPKFNIFWMYALIIAFLISMWLMNQGGSVAQEVNWTQFENIVEKGGIKSITVFTNKNYVEAVLVDSMAADIMKDIPKTEAPFGPTERAANRIVTQISSSDKFADYVEQWKQKGVFNVTALFACKRFHLRVMMRVWMTIVLQQPRIRYPIPY